MWSGSGSVTATPQHRPIPVLKARRPGAAAHDPRPNANSLDLGSPKLWRRCEPGWGGIALPNELVAAHRSCRRLDLRARSVDQAEPHAPTFAAHRPLRARRARRLTPAIYLEGKHQPGAKDLALFPHTSPSGPKHLIELAALPHARAVLGHA